ncbi:MAG: major facilitator superfamily permease, partial [Proteobacteria bacterium]|nr:major facilitator superfamily permease [Pseudomonadota bacterium]
MALFGLATILLGLSQHFVLSMLALFLLGAGDMVGAYIRQMLVKLETPDAIRGRVSAVNSVFIGTSNELGEFESGIAATLPGLVPSVIFGGTATLLVMQLWIHPFPSLRTMDALTECRGDDRTS